MINMMEKLQELADDFKERSERISEKSENEFWIDDETEYQINTAVSQAWNDAYSDLMDLIEDFEEEEEELYYG